MGIEGRLLSIDQIKAALDRGEIVRGDKGFEAIRTPDTTINYNRITGQVYFNQDNVTTHAEITNGRVVGIQLTESDTGKPFSDHATLLQRKKILVDALQAQLFN